METVQHQPEVSGRIVVGVDGSESSKAALRWAARLAPVVGDEIEAILAWEYPTNFGWAAGGIPEDWRPDVDAAQALNAVLDDVFGDQRPSGLTVSTREGHAAAVLLEASRDAAMLIVGSRGHGGFASLLLGSVSTVCAEHGHCPVLVVHAT